MGRVKDELVANLHEVGKEAVGEFGIARLGDILHGILEELVLLAQVHGLLVAVVALVQVCRDATELEEFVPLQGLCELDVVDVAEVVEGVAQAGEVTLLDEEAIEGIVDSLQGEMDIYGW